MSEEQKVQAIEDVVDADTAQKLGDASLSRIKMFSKMCKEYVRALNGGRINSLEVFQCGMDMIVLQKNQLLKVTFYTMYQQQFKKIGYLMH